MVQDELVQILGAKFACVDKGFGTNKPVDVVIRPEDVKLVKPEFGTIEGEVRHLIFKGVHYEMEVHANGFDWLVHSTKKCSLLGKKLELRFHLPIFKSCINLLPRTRRLQALKNKKL